MGERRPDCVAESVDSFIDLTSTPANLVNLDEVGQDQPIDQTQGLFRDVFMASDNHVDESKRLQNFPAAPSSRAKQSATNNFEQPGSQVILLPAPVGSAEADAIEFLYGDQNAAVEPLPPSRIQKIKQRRAEARAKLA